MRCWAVFALLSLVVGLASAVTELEQCQATLEQLKITVGCNDCLVAGAKETMLYSGGCSTNSRGTGWGRLCLDTEEVNQRNALGERFYKKFDDTHVQVLRAGLYDMHFSGHSYAQGTHPMWSTLRIDDRHYDYWHFSSHDREAAPFDNHLVWNLGANNRISGEVHMTGSDAIRIRSMRGLDGRNRLQIRYLGPFEEVVFFSGGYTGHRRGTGWAHLPVNQIEMYNSKSKSFFSVGSDGKMTVIKPGFYRCHSRIMSHGHTGNKFISIRVDGKETVNNQGHNHAWRQQRADAVLPLKAGQTVLTLTKVEGGDPYYSHAHNTHGHTSRITFQYEGKLGNYADGSHTPNHGKGEMKGMQYGPKVKAQTQDFAVMKLDHRFYDTMPDSIATHSADDSFEIHETGWFRIHATAVLYTSNYGIRQGKITIGEEIVATSKESSAKETTTLHMDYIFRARAQDKIQVHWQTQGENPIVEPYIQRKTFVELISLSNP